MIIIKIISSELLDTIKGVSSVPVWTGIAIAALIVFLSGVIEGITNPRGCQG